MITKVQKWGNSQGLRLSKEVLAGADLEVGDAVEIAVSDGTLVITPVHRVRGGVDLAQLVREIPAEYSAGEVDWATPAGREVW